jgi:UDP-hydrolysing UDP-N-acetyl-D-glucosamine 2-epimerase
MIKKRKIAVFTGARAEYGLLSNLMKAIQNSNLLELKIIAGAMHYSPEFGCTYKEIEGDGFKIDFGIEMLLSSDSRVGVLKSMSLGISCMADAINLIKPESIILLGDRYEALVAAQSALIMGIPIFHIHGGEITSGAYDDSIRHAITKMATFHFTAAEPYRRRVIQMGEEPKRVFNVGAIGLDNLIKEPCRPWEQVCKKFQLAPDRETFLVTYHPATNSDEDPALTSRAIFKALDRFPNHQVVITYPNADNGGRAIIDEIKSYIKQTGLLTVVVPSLGFKDYSAILRNTKVVIGNSSSGLIEAPSFRVPTVDVGQRQNGRIMAGSVIKCNANEVDIFNAIKQALTPKHQAITSQSINPYGQGDTNQKIVEFIEGLNSYPQKNFYNIESY